MNNKEIHSTGKVWSSLFHYFLTLGQIKHNIYTPIQNIITNTKINHRYKTCFQITKYAQIQKLYTLHKIYTDLYVTVDTILVVKL